MSYGPKPAPKPVPTASVNVGLTNDHGGVDKNSVTIKKGDSVTWSSKGHGGADILFDKGDGTPFSKPNFHCDSGGSVSSGPAAKSGTFNYSVHGEHGNNDPVIVVDP